jgi:hypothetical protein
MALVFVGCICYPRNWEVPALSEDHKVMNGVRFLTGKGKNCACAAFSRWCAGVPAENNGGALLSGTGVCDAMDYSEFYWPVPSGTSDLYRLPKPKGLRPMRLYRTEK